MTGGPTVIPAETRIDGRVETAGDLLVCGRCDGDLIVGGTLTVAAGGVCRAIVRARIAIIHGEVIGGIICAESLMLADGARVVGDIRAPNVDVAAGAHLEGKLDLLPPAPADEQAAQLPLSIRNLRGAPRAIPTPPRAIPATPRAPTREPSSQ